MTMKKTQNQILKEYPELQGLAEKNGSKPSKVRVLTKQRELCSFADEQKLVIHPRGYDYYIESYLMFDCCPCNSTRKSCPCEQAIEEVARDGHCLCRLFWRSYQEFVKQMFKEA